ncbi:hypothetical protein ACWGJX_48155 [Streptomyces sp. NPDC054775]
MGDDRARDRFAGLGAPGRGGLAGLGGFELAGDEQRLQALRLGAGAQEVREVRHDVGRHPAPELLATVAQLGVPVGDGLGALLLGDVDQGADVGVRRGPLERGDLVFSRSGAVSGAHPWTLLSIVW